MPTMRGTITALLLFYTAATTLAEGHVRGNKLTVDYNGINKNAAHLRQQRNDKQSQIIIDSTTAVKTTPALNELIDNEEDARKRRIMKSGKGKGGRWVHTLVLLGHLEYFISS